MQEEKEVYLWFKTSALTKRGNSLIEIIVGLIVLFIPVRYFVSLVKFLTKGEII